MSKIFRAYDHAGVPILVMAAQDDSLVWAYARGFRLPVHSVSEMDINSTQFTVLMQAAELDSETLDLLRRRHDYSGYYLVQK